MVFVSRLNYPGGEALTRLHALVDAEPGVSGAKRVHMDTLSCMTGVTRFLEKTPSPLAQREEGVWWVYDKTENETMLLDPLFWEAVDYAIAEDPKRIPGRWEVMDIISAFSGVGVVRPGDGPAVEDLTWGL